MNKKASAPIKTANAFAEGFGALDEAEKERKRQVKRDKKKAEREAQEADDRARGIEPPKVEAQAPQKITSWADADSDDDLMGLSPLQDQYQKELDDEMVSDDDSDPEDEPQSASPGIEFNVKKDEAPAEPQKVLSKKEQKQKEMEDLDAVLNEMGIQPAEQGESAPAEEIPQEEAAPAAAEGEEGEGKKKRSRGGKKKKGGGDEQEGPAEPAKQPEEKDIAKILAAKNKGKKGGSKKKSAAEIAAAEAAARKAANKKNKDKSKYNEMPTR